MFDSNHVFNAIVRLHNNTDTHNLLHKLRTPKCCAEQLTFALALVATDAPRRNVRDNKYFQVHEHSHARCAQHERNEGDDDDIRVLPNFTTHFPRSR